MKRLISVFIQQTYIVDENEDVQELLEQDIGNTFMEEPFSSIILDREIIKDISDDQLENLNQTINQLCQKKIIKILKEIK